MLDVPVIKVIGRYNSGLAYSDLLAALIVTLMLVPQSLAYALLAGLPPEIGLYSSVLPLVFYAIFGTSSALAVGPVAVISLMTGTTIFAVSSSTSYAPVEIGIALALLSGLMLVIMGLLKLGFIANFLSRSVVEGFIMASSILIAVSQLRHIFGIKMEGHNLYEMGLSLYENLPNYDQPTLILGVVVIIFLWLVKKAVTAFLKKQNVSTRKVDFVARVFPAVMIIATIMLMEHTRLGNTDIAIVGYIPNGLPNFALINIDLELFQLLLVPALLISIIGYVESISVANSFAVKSKDQIEPNQEFLALGAANISSSFSGGMPVTGGFSRSVVNFNAGAKTPLAAMYTALFIAILMSGIMTFLEFLPKATLAATIIVAVLGLVDFNKLKNAWLFSKSDFALTIITILTTLFIGVEVGISVGMILSICLHLYQTSKPHMAVVGLVPGTEHFRNINRHQVETVPEIIGIRVDESLYFANSAYLEKEVIRLVSESDQIQHCILQCTSVSDIDASALESLEIINSNLKEMHIDLHLSEVKGPVMDKLKKCQLLHELTGDVHLSHYKAVQILKSSIENKTS